MSFDARIRLAIMDALGMWRFRWPALALAWCIAVAGWGWALTLPDQFKAHSRVYVDTESVLEPLMQGLTVRTDTLSQVQLMTRALLSRPQLRAVAQETGLDVRAKSPEELEMLLEKLEMMISIDGSSTPQLFSITYTDKDPVMARAVVGSLLERFMIESLGENRKESQQAQNFIEKQIELDEQRLYEAEMRLAEFKKANVGLLPGREGDYFSKLGSIEGDIFNLEARTRLLNERHSELLRQIEGEEPTFGLVAPIGNDGFKSGPSSSVDGAIANLEKRIQDMLLRLTEKHPDVVRSRETLTDLKNIRDEELKNNSASAAFTMQNTPDQFGSGGLDMNPVYQHMRIELSESEVEMVTLKAELSDKRRSLARLKKQVDAIPEVEAKLTRLNRDYNVVRSRHEAMLTRLESAKLAEDLQTDNEKVAFRVIDPPFVPMAPVGPNRMPLLLVILFVALGAGGAMTYLLNLQFPVFFSALQLSDVTKLPVFGVINDFSNKTGNLSGWLFALGAVGLITVCGLLIVTESITVNALQSLGQGI